MQIENATNRSCFAILCWHLKYRVAPVYALSEILPTSQIFCRSHFIAALDAPMGTFRAEATFGGGRLAVGPVDAKSTLPGAGPLRLVHIYTQICALHLIIFA
uniref:(northern house mosquito) hypothetical protein n=1 Tax=Culex pipiens TaxID=7175 RepID=A0A8D8JEA9_CULPI